MKNKYITLCTAMTLLIVSLVGCSKKEFPYQMAEVAPEDVTDIHFYTGAEMMITDGKATLKFIVETFKDYTTADGTVVKKLFDYRLLPEGSVKIFEETTNKEVGFTYSTDVMSSTNPRFYAQIGNIKSAVKEVKLRPAPPTPQKLYVDVIFHVWELNPTNTAFDLSSFQPITHDDIVKGLATMNDVINNKIGSNPNGAAANVEFRLAAKNQAGQDLALPGYNKIIYSNEIKRNPTAATIALSDFGYWIDLNKPTYIWNPKLYLNVHVLPSGSNNVLGHGMPPKQLPPGPGEELIPGIAGIAVDDNDFVNGFTTSTLFLPYTLFHPGYERKVEIFSYFGAFYGLWTTSAYNATRFHSDFCEDTPEYNSSLAPNNFTSALKTGMNGEKFIIENAMDDTRYPSARNSITLDQVNRMRAVMTRAPGRMNAKTH